MCEDRTPQGQFVSDFLMVAENDQNAYNAYRNLVAEKGTARAGVEIQEKFEIWISRLAKDEEERENEFGSLLLRQLLIGWGADAFYQIAKRFEDDEINKDEDFLTKPTLETI
jgi:hypothetical protein